MKKLLVLIFGMTFLSFFARAQTSRQVAPPQIDQVTQAINAQVQVTKDNLNNVIKQLSEPNPSDAYNDVDYNAMAPVFRNRVSVAMVKFDATMNNVIKPKAKVWLDDFKFKADSNKDNLEYLNHAYQTTTSNLKVVNEIYVRAVKQILVDALGSVPNGIEYNPASIPPKQCNIPPKEAVIAEQYAVFDFFGKTLISFPETFCIIPTRYNRSEWRVFSQSGQSVSWDSIIEAYLPKLDAEILKSWTSECKTSNCRHLRLNDLVSFVDLVDAVVNRSFVLMTYDSPGVYNRES